MARFDVTRPAVRVETFEGLLRLGGNVLPGISPLIRPQVGLLQVVRSPSADLATAVVTNRFAEWRCCAVQTAIMKLYWPDRGSGRIDF